MRLINAEAERRGEPVQGLMDTMRLNMNTAHKSEMAKHINTVYYTLKNKEPFPAVSHSLHLWLESSSDVTKLTNDVSDQCWRK